MDPEMDGRVRGEYGHDTAKEKTFVFSLQIATYLQSEGADGHWYVDTRRCNDRRTSYRLHQHCNTPSCNPQPHILKFFEAAVENVPPFPASFLKHTFHEYARYCCHKRRSNYGSACGAWTAVCTEDCNGETTKGAVLIAMLHTLLAAAL